MSVRLCCVSAIGLCYILCMLPLGGGGRFFRKGVHCYNGDTSSQRRMAIFSELRRLQTAAVYVGCYSYTKVAVSRVLFLVSSVFSAQAEQLAIKSAARICSGNNIKETLIVSFFAIMSVTLHIAWTMRSKISWLISYFTISARLS